MEMMKSDMGGGAAVVGAMLAIAELKPKINVIGMTIGGGFGAKFGGVVDTYAVLLAQATGKPVKVVYSREEDMLDGRPAPGLVMTIKTGVSKDGKLIARKATAFWDVGVQGNGSWATARVRAFWARVRQGFAILRDRSEYLSGVVSWQALGWGFRLATIYFMLRAFHLPATIHNALLVQIAQSLSTLLPITPGGAGTEQGLLLYLFRGKAARSALLSFSVGMHIAIVVVNVLLGLLAVALMTRSLSFRRLRKDAAADAAGVTPPP